MAPSRTCPFVARGGADEGDALPLIIRFARLTTPNVYHRTQFVRNGSLTGHWRVHACNGMPGSGVADRLDGLASGSAIIGAGPGQSRRSAPYANDVTCQPRRPGRAGRYFDLTPFETPSVDRYRAARAACTARFPGIASAGSGRLDDSEPDPNEAGGGRSRVTFS